MGTSTQSQFLLRLFLTALCAVSCGRSFAQDLPVRERAPILVPNNVLSVRTDMIRAKAQYLQAMGDFQESIGLARIYHAKAKEMEIRNHAAWVKTYFELKDLNKAYYLKEHPPFIDRQARIQAIMRNRHVNNPHLDLQGDISDETLNWYLRELGTTVQAVEIFGRRRGEGFVDMTLPAPDLAAILMTDGARKGGVRTIFAASEARALETRWPFILLAPEFEPDRQAFEDARQAAIDEMLKRRSISFETGMSLKESADRLRYSLERNYPKARRADPKVWQEYQKALLFLNGLALSIDRINSTQNARLLDGSLQFQGNTVPELIRHMCNNGLEFAPPRPGSEAVYRKLYMSMRDIWLATHPNN